MAADDPVAGRLGQIDEAALRHVEQQWAEPDVLTARHPDAFVLAGSVEDQFVRRLGRQGNLDVLDPAGRVHAVVLLLCAFVRRSVIRGGAGRSQWLETCGPVEGAPCYCCRHRANGSTTRVTTYTRLAE